MPMRSPFVVMFAFVLLVLTVLSSAAQATTPGRNGLVAFTRYRLQNSPIWSAIFVARPDGSGLKKVSHSSRPLEDDQAHWSPDGRLIVFDRCTAGGPCSLWLVRADGSAQRRLTRICHSNSPNVVCSDDSGPSFAPDGRHIVFTHEWGKVRHLSTGDQIQHSAIATMDLKGGHLKILRQLAPYAGDLQSPRISPNGNLLVFDRYNSARANPADGDALFVVATKGGKSRRVTRWSLSAGSPDWSRKGGRVLLKRFVSGARELAPGSNLYTISADGTDLRRVTNVGPSHYVLAGAFSPDGRSIVYATDRASTPNPHGGTFADVFTMRLGKHPPKPVNRSANLDGWPTWGTG